ncbi:hypothetical protein [Flavobacterium coralii]|uniref:hypothetical protein n=1 Tax=Flavobacterium coralii TaxID=2838017 RepID=UPI0032B2C204
MKTIIPVILDFFAKLLNISGLVNAVQDIIAKVTAPIHKAIDKFVAWISKLMEKVLKRFKGKGKEEKRGTATEEEKEETRTTAAMQKDLDKGVEEGTNYLKAKQNINKKDADKHLSTIKSKYSLKDLKLVVDKNNEDGKDLVHVHGEVNPVKEGQGFEFELDEDNRPKVLIGKLTPNLDKLEKKEPGVTVRYVDEFFNRYKGLKYKKPTDIVNYVEHRAARKLGKTGEGSSIEKYSEKSKINGLTKPLIDVFENNNLTGTYRTRIPDIYKEGVVVGDIKDVASLSLDEQMRDNIAIIQGRGRYKNGSLIQNPPIKFDLVVRDSKDKTVEGTYISGPLERAIRINGGEIYELI